MFVTNCLMFFIHLHEENVNVQLDFLAQIVHSEDDIQHLLRQMIVQ